jgi:hypothetical protein
MRILSPYAAAFPRHGFLKACAFAVAIFAGTHLAHGQQSSPPGQSSRPLGGSAVLPIPQPQFGGVIGRKASESTPDFPKSVTAPDGAPNVLLIMTDDTGFGCSSHLRWSHTYAHP